MVKETRVFKEVARVTRWQIGKNGIEQVFVEWDRVKRVATMRIDGVLQWEMSGVLAERFFYKYGLLTGLK